jgi:peptidoglycan/xylan/chitin deacetylase (PgdA/CDA1 family)
MWRYRIITGVFALLAVVLFILPFTGTMRIFLLALVLIALVALLIWGASSICSGIFIRAVCRGERDSNHIALTFDDGPHPFRSRQIMDLLHRFNGKASFFLTGVKLEGNERIVREMAIEGHTVGNHSFSHSNLFPLFSGRRIAGEIIETNRLIEGITGRQVRFFRPPFGVTNPNIYRGLKGLNMRTAGWSIRSFDTRNERPEKVVSRILNRLGGGDIVLLHETSEHILEILEQILKEMKARGLECVSVDRLLEGDNTNMT